MPQRYTEDNYIGHAPERDAGVQTSVRGGRRGQRAGCEARRAESAPDGAVADRSVGDEPGQGRGDTPGGSPGTSPVRTHPAATPNNASTAAAATGGIRATATAMTGLLVLRPITASIGFQRWRLARTNRQIDTKVVNILIFKVRFSLG